MPRSVRLNNIERPGPFCRHSGTVTVRAELTYGEAGHVQLPVCPLVQVTKPTKPEEKGTMIEIERYTTAHASVTH